MGLGPIKRSAVRAADLALGTLVSAPLLSKGRLLRRRLYASMDLYRHTYVYSDIGPERYLSDSRDKVIGRELFCTGEFDFDKFMTVLRLIGGTDGLVLIDVGANIGPVCIPAVNRGYVARAIAIEPHPENARLLRANIALNDLTDRIAVHQCASGAQDGESLNLGLSAINFGDHRITSGSINGKSVPVRSDTLDTIYPPDEAANALLWVDTQGYEGYVLAGATAWLARGVPVCTEIAPYLMKHSESFAQFKIAVAAYAGFFDLEKPARFRPVSELDALYREMGDSRRYTDILLLSQPPQAS